MKQFKPKYKGAEQLESGWMKGTNYRTGRSKRRANKLFRRTAKDLRLFKYSTIYVPNYKQRAGYEM